MTWPRLRSERIVAKSNPAKAEIEARIVAELDRGFEIEPKPSAPIGQGRTRFGLPVRNGSAVRVWQPYVNATKLAQMRVQADAAGQPFLAYLIEMARVEAGGRAGKHVSEAVAHKIGNLLWRLRKRGLVKGDADGAVNVWTLPIR